nr:MAG TPA: hypothetical protein [Bacteriophage sp.]
MPLISVVPPSVVQTVVLVPDLLSNFNPVAVSVTPPGSPLLKELILIPFVVSIVTLLVPSLSCNLPKLLPF